jgi:hypothetical protein
MKKLVVTAILLIFPFLTLFAMEADGPGTKSVNTQIRVIIPPFAVIQLADNTLKAIPLDEVSKHLKHFQDSKSTTDQTDPVSATVESNQEIITATESKTERTPTSLQITTTYTSTQQ